MATDVSASALPLKEGDLVAGKYRVEGFIGEGGMGAVLRATHVDLDRKVAIKIVREDLASREELVERLLLEARAVANLRSEHVARVLDVGRLESSAPYIVMEYLEGADLGFVLVEHGRVAIPLAVDFIVQACEAIAEAHASGIIHRDLKPENLFLTQRNDGAPIVKVLDFGISKHVHNSGRAITNPTGGVGSPSYMAPEQMRAATEVDARADIWSLGAILFELLTGRTPFEADTLPTVCAMVLGQEPPAPREVNPEIPEALEAIVLRCLHKDRDARYNDVADLAAALAPFGSDGTRWYADRVQGVLTKRASTPALLVQSVTGLPFPPRRSVVPLTMTPVNASQLSIQTAALPVRSSESKPHRGFLYALLVLGIVSTAMGVVWGVGRASRADASARMQAPVDAPKPAVPAVQPESVQPISVVPQPGVSVVAEASATPTVTTSKPKVRARVVAAPAVGSPATGASANPPAPAQATARTGGATRGTAKSKRDAWDESNFGGRR